jgi:hypothetical protein
MKARFIAEDDFFLSRILPRSGRLPRNSPHLGCVPGSLHMCTISASLCMSLQCTVQRLACELHTVKLPFFWIVV